MFLVILAATTLFSVFNKTAKQHDFDYYTVFTYTPSLNYNFENTQTNETLKLDPSQSSIVGIELKRKGILYLLAYESESEKSKSQKTNFFDASLAYGHKRNLFKAYYQNYQGLFVNVENQINLNNKRNIRSVSYGFKHYYFAKSGYNPDEMVLNQKKSLKSGGSLVYKAQLNRTILKSESDIFNSSNFPDIDGLSMIDIYNLSYEAGYTYTWRYKWMHLNALGSLGLNVNYLKSRSLSARSINKMGIGPSLSLNIDIGILNLKKLSGGFIIDSEFQDTKLDSTTLTRHYNVFTLYLRHFF